MTKTRDLANLIADSKVGPSEIDTTGTYNMNALQVGGTTVIDSSRDGSFADLEFTGSLTHAWTNSGVISIGVAQRGGNIFNTGQNLLQVMGADAYIGSQAMAGGDLLLRGGSAVDNAGLSVYPGDVTIRGGVPHSGTDGNSGKIYLQTGGTSENRLTIRGDGNIGVGMAGSSSAKFTIQGKAGTVGNSITDKTLHVIEGGYNDGPTFQVSNSSGVSRFQVDGDGKVGIGTDPDATLHVNGPAIIGSDDNIGTSPIAGLHILDNSYSHWSSTLSKQQVALRVETYWNAASGQRAVGKYGGGIGFNHLGGHSVAHDENLHSWIGPRVVSTPDHETSALVFATNNTTNDEDAGIAEKMVIMPNGNVGIGIADPRNDLHVGGAISSLKGVSNSASLVKVVGRGVYHVLASNNYGAGSAVRHAAYYVCLDYEGDEINHTETVFNNNSMTVSFYISGGWLYCNNLPSGNNQISVFGM